MRCRSSFRRGDDSSRRISLHRSALRIQLRKDTLRRGVVLAIGGKGPNDIGARSFQGGADGTDRKKGERDLVPKICEEIFQELVFIDTNRIFDEALSIALETGSRAADSFYIASVKVEGAILISNDKFQIESAKRSGIEAYSLLQDKEIIEKRLGDIES